MACPAPKSYRGSDSVEASFRPSRGAANGAATALVDAAAKRSCISAAISEGLCPRDCPFPRTSNVSFTITSVTTAPHWFVNILVGWFTRFFSGHWWYRATASYTYSGTVSCHVRRPWIAVADDVEVDPPFDIA